MAWSCPAAQDVLGKCSIFLQKRYFSPMSFKELWIHLCKSTDLKIVEEFSVVSRLIWQRRNNFIFQTELSQPKCVIKQASNALVGLESIRNSRVKLKPGQQIEEKWSAPPENTYKFNWDAVVNKVNCRIRLWVIVTDHRGHMITALRKNRPLFPDPLLAEACGPLEAVKLGIQMGINQMVLEGDS